MSFIYGEFEDYLKQIDDAKKKHIHSVWDEKKMEFKEWEIIGDYEQGRDYRTMYSAIGAFRVVFCQRMWEKLRSYSGNYREASND